MRYISENMAGLVLTLPHYFEDIPIDFFASDGKSTVIMAVDWWRNEWAYDPQLLIFVDAVPVYKEYRFHFNRIGTGATIMVGKPDTDEDVKILDDARIRIDVARVEYIKQLRSLAEWTNFDLSLWRDAISARPVFDVEKHRTKVHECIVFKVFLGDEVIDTVILTSNGGGVSANGTKRAEELLRSWAYEQLSGMSLEVACDWLLSFRQPAGFALSTPIQAKIEGMLKQVAKKRMPVRIKADV